MLCCFFLMYKDIKRIEGNVLNLRSKCNQLETQVLTKQDENMDKMRYNNIGNDVVDNEDVDIVADNEDVDVVVDNEDVVADNEDVDNEDNLNLLKEVTLQNENDEIDDLLNEVGNIQLVQDNDLSKLNKKELLEKTNNELKEYLKSVGKSISGNKKELVETILN